MEGRTEAAWSKLERFSPAGSEEIEGRKSVAAVAVATKGRPIITVVFITKIIASVKTLPQIFDLKVLYFSRPLPEGDR